MSRFLPMIILLAALVAAPPGYAQARTGVERITLNELEYGSAGAFRVKVTVAVWIIKF